MQKKELNVSALQNGTVIDHIAQGKGMQVLNMLGLANSEHRIYLGINLESEKYGKKDLIKVADRFFESSEFNKIALISPSATIIEIKDYEVVNKDKVSIPDQIQKSVKCANPNCITNVQDVPTRFYVIDKKDLKLKCHYCEKNTTEKMIAFI